MNYVTEAEKIRTYKAFRQAEKFREILKAAILQKVSGVTLAVAGIIAPALLEWDATASLLLIPLGLFVIFTKEKIM